MKRSFSSFHNLVIKMFKQLIGGHEIAIETIVLLNARIYEDIDLPRLQKDPQDVVASLIIEYISTKQFHS